MITVFMPTRNRRTLLERAIKSVQRQSYRNFELIVVNDCSTDGTRQYLDEVTNQDSRITAYHFDQRRGAPAARNHALEHSRGMFLTGIDDDDEFTESRLETFLAAWNALGDKLAVTACLFSPLLLVDKDVTVIHNNKVSEVFYLDLFRSNSVGNQVFCPIEYIRGIGGFDESLPAWQDLELLIRLLKKYGAARQVSEATYICHTDTTVQRISKNEAAVRQAYFLIKSKHRDVSRERYNILYLQMFSKFYGIKPKISDFYELYCRSASIGIFIRLLRAVVRNR